jgi:ABC-type sugar transport system permease subunit
MATMTAEPTTDQPSEGGPGRPTVDDSSTRGRTAILAGLLLLGFLAAAFVVPVAEAEVGALTRNLQRVLAAAIGTGGVLGALQAFRSPTLTLTRRVARLALALTGTGLVWWLYLDRDGVRGAVHSVVLALVLSATLFVLANRWLDQSLRAWARFTGISGAMLGLLLGAVLVGNDAMGLFLGTAGSRVDRSVWLIPVVGVLGAVYGVAVGGTSGRTRLLVGVAGGTGLGAVVGAFLRTGALPLLEPVALLVATVVLAVVGAGLARLRGRDVLRGALLGAAGGLLLGGFGLPELGTGTVPEAIVVTAVLGAIVGLRLGLAPTLEIGERLRIEGRIRTVIFLAPALTFLSAALIVPTIRTIYISFLELGSGDFIGLENFAFIFGQPSFYDVSAWRGIFGATEFVAFSLALTVGMLMAVRQRRRIDGLVPPRLVASSAAAALLLVGGLADRSGALDGLPVAAWPIVAGLVIVVLIVVMVDYLRRNRGNSGFSGPGGGFLGLAALMLSFAVFVQLRGTLFNNLWWVVLVTATSAGLGLAIAALADRARAEAAAKSIIFMPMALSFVGAGIIWRFMYIARPQDDPQTGVLNALWVGLGNLAVSDSAGTAGVVTLGIAALLLVFAVLALRQGALGTGWMSGFLALGMAWLGSLFLAGNGVAGVQVVDGEPLTTALLFISGTQQFGAYNNVFIMIPFIWVYTGFAMVIFSAAIKGVPADLLEAGRVDGANEAQSFWGIVLPQIRPTIGVVITTIVVVVMKVFDIVKVMTNGNFGTQVLANEMWNRAFIDANFGVGSAVATVLFLSVLPVMYVNIRRMQKEAA